MIVPGATHNAKEKLKTLETKTNLIDFNNFSHTQVLRCIFEIHRIVDKYKISPVWGPDFKLWCTGAGYFVFVLLNAPHWSLPSSGGKAGALTIRTDKDYNILVTALHHKPASTNIGISFNLDEIAAFKIHAKRGATKDQRGIFLVNRQSTGGGKSCRKMDCETRRDGWSHSCLM